MKSMKGLLFLGLLVVLLFGFGIAVGFVQASAQVVFEDDFESGALGPEWTVSSSTAQGRIGVSNALGTPANSGNFHLAMDRTPAGAFNRNEAILTLDLSTFVDVVLEFSHKDVNDEDNALPPSFGGSFNGDGVSISEDGVNWFTLVSLNNANSPNRVYTDFVFDLSAAATGADISLGSNFQIKFQQFDNFPFTTDGRTFDDIGVTATKIVQIDIKPGSDPNCIKPTSKGTIPVAVDGSSVNINDIDVSTLELAGVGPPVRTSTNKDVIGDSALDLVAHFSTTALNGAGVLNNGANLSLTGALNDGSLIDGSDQIFLAGGPDCFDQAP